FIRGRGCARCARPWYFQVQGLPAPTRGGAVMKKAPLYSRSRQRIAPPALPSGAAAQRESVNTAPSLGSPASGGTATPPLARRFASRMRGWTERHRLMAGAMLAALLVLGGAFADRALVAQPVPLTQRDIDAAVRQSLEKEPLPSAYAKAYAAVRPSV